MSGSFSAKSKAAFLSPVGKGHSEGRWKPYPAYKDSGVEWLGEMPEHWSLAKIKYSTYVKGRVGWQNLRSEEFVDDGPYCVTGTDFVNGRVVWERCYHVTFERYQIDPYIQLKPADLLITKDGSIGKLALIDHLPDLACLNSGLFVTRPLDNRYITKYLYWVLSSKVFSGFIDFMSAGSTIQHLYQYVFNTFQFPLPTIDEQRAIAAFLDRETSKIDALIARKQRLIGLLQEKRTTLISQAVTKGLDPDAPMKDSGVEWIDRIPLGWIGTSLKRWVETKITDGPHETPDFISEGIPFVSAEAVQDGKINFESKRGFISPDQHRRYSKKLLPRRDDVFLVKSGATTGKVAKVETDIEFNVWSPMTLIRADFEKVIPDFVYQALQSDYIQKQIQQTWSAGTQPNIAMGDIERIFFIAPSLSLQEKIVNYIQKETSKINNLITKVQAAVQSLQEYRTALISAAVTGKIDVRISK